jgi:(2Fe-2S) ferredoxin
MVAGWSARSSGSGVKKRRIIDTSQRRRHRPGVAGRHLFICTNPRASGKPACGPGGGDALITAVQRMLLERHATDVLVTACGCLGPCFDGPNAVVYPDAVWYGNLTVDDAAGLVDHLVHGVPLTTKLAEAPPGSGAGAGAGAGEDDPKPGDR